ncbi:MAG: hypothetical protein D6710_01815 [Nitrospirae bacterium]|nr:MAG: hypothetical protein D6710_01815 [Nitrospirota bacterium]
MVDVTGAINDLSGRMLSLERYILTIPNQNDFDELGALSNQRYNDLTTRLDSIQNTLDDLLQYVVNIKLDLTNLTDLFNTHTGQPASSGHNGL